MRPRGSRRAACRHLGGSRGQKGTSAGGKVLTLRYIPYRLLHIPALRCDGLLSACHAADGVVLVDALLKYPESYSTKLCGYDVFSCHLPRLGQLGKLIGTYTLQLPILHLSHDNPFIPLLIFTSLPISDSVSLRIFCLLASLQLISYPQAPLLFSTKILVCMRHSYT